MLGFSVIRYIFSTKSPKWDWGLLRGDFLSVTGNSWGENSRVPPYFVKSKSEITVTHVH